MFEPNNSQTQSTTMSDGTYTDLVVCEVDDDWYSFEAQAEQVVDILVQITDEEGDIDLQLYDPLGGELESSQTAYKTTNILIVFNCQMTVYIGFASNIIEVERVTLPLSKYICSHIFTH